MINDDAAIPTVTDVPYGMDMTTSFRICDQWYTMRFGQFREAERICKEKGRRPINQDIMEAGLKMGLQAVRFTVNPSADPIGIVYLV